MKKLNRMKKLWLLSAVLMGLASSTSAQTHKKDTTLNRTVVVEQQYNPDIMDAQKVNALPGVKQINTTPGQVEYDRSATPTSAVPGGTMSAFRAEEYQEGAKQGFVRVGYGTKGSLDMEGNYTMTLSAIDRINLSATVDGMNGKAHSSFNDARWDSRFYRTNAAADFTHNFKTVDFRVAGSFGLNNFNHLTALYSDKRRSVLYDAHIGLRSTDRGLPLQFDLQTGVMGFKRAYDPFYAFQSSSKETIIRTKGDVRGELINDAWAGVAFEMNNMLYDASGFKNYTMLDLNPYYEYSERNFMYRIGAHVDLATAVDKRLRVAPDIKAEYLFSGDYVVYGQLTGGRLLNDLRHLEQLNPYGLLSGQIASAYEQLNALVGFRMTPVLGLSVNLFGGYQQIKDETFDYLSWIGIDETTSVEYAQQKISNLHAGVEFSYDYNGLFNLMLKGEVFKWNEDSKEWKLLQLKYKPQMRLDARVGVRPIDPLYISVDYSFARRNHYNQIYGWRFADKHINSLNLMASYNLIKHISVYARASNLLDRKYEVNVLDPMYGFSILGGVKVEF